MLIVTKRGQFQTMNITICGSYTWRKEIISVKLEWATATPPMYKMVERASSVQSHSTYIVNSPTISYFFIHNWHGCTPEKFFMFEKRLKFLWNIHALQGTLNLMNICSPLSHWLYVINYLWPMNHSLLRDGQFCLLTEKLFFIWKNFICCGF